MIYILKIIVLSIFYTNYCDDIPKKKKKKEKKKKKKKKKKKNSWKNVF